VTDVEAEMVEAPLLAEDQPRLILTVPLNAGDIHAARANAVLLLAIPEVAAAVDRFGATICGEFDNAMPSFVLCGQRVPPDRRRCGLYADHRGECEPEAMAEDAT
jgi:hypothetical protein